MNENIQNELDRLTRECADIQRKIAWLAEHAHLIPADLPVSFCGHILDFDNLNHAQVIQVLKAFGGKWDKTLNGGDRVDYRQQVDGVDVRCYRGEPPPNCQIIETTEIVPAQPETTRKVRKLVCKEVIDASQSL